jgi:hypothetical protein
MLIAHREMSYSLKIMSRPIAICEHCKGTGKAQISIVLAATLECVSKTPIPTSDVIAKLDDSSVKATAINNRLTHLKALGFIAESHREGKSIFWKRIK